MIAITNTVKHLIIINVLVYIAVVYIVPEFYDTLALYFPENPNFHYWQYITSMFVHSKYGIGHILFNMLGLWMFGSTMEDVWGKQKFLFFYFSSGIGASLIYTGVNYFEYKQIYNSLIDAGVSHLSIENILNTGSYNTSIKGLVSREKLEKLYLNYHTPSVGASGAIYGVLIAYGLYFPQSKLAMIFLPIPIAAKYFIPFLILADLLFGISRIQTGVAHFAHIGGALIGFIIAYYWKKNRFNQNRWN